MTTPVGVMRDPAYIAKVKDIKGLNRTRAMGIDRKAKEVEVRNLETGETQRLPYDKLILATGGETTEPPIPGKDLANVLRNKLDGLFTGVTCAPGRPSAFCGAAATPTLSFLTVGLWPGPTRRCREASRMHGGALQPAPGYVIVPLARGDGVVIAFLVSSPNRLRSRVCWAMIAAVTAQPDGRKQSWHSR